MVTSTAVGNSLHSWQRGNIVKLLCVVVEGSAFPVDVNASESVGDLKDAIKDKKKNDLETIGPDRLEETKTLHYWLFEKDAMPQPSMGQIHVLMVVRIGVDPRQLRELAALEQLLDGVLELKVGGDSDDKSSVQHSTVACTSDRSFGTSMMSSRNDWRQIHRSVEFLTWDRKDSLRGVLTAAKHAFVCASPRSTNYNEFVKESARDSPTRFTWRAKTSGCGSSISLGAKPRFLFSSSSQSFDPLGKRVKKDILRNLEELKDQIRLFEQDVFDDRMKHIVFHLYRDEIEPSDSPMWRILLWLSRR
ncbi:TPA: LOW QUALITY PROTEIN: hypothetical protein N0F65_011548 [Lagenidium giganteum]|uniref:Crinkler effector protein N-terminal domain-containing protein n=1 Tax=Lagenidium giganteum TaxID=4803 RepID=A0AAV2Z7C7_9STRA|nr:TPA: LOW QUALITY PROTEIN: hypothetical protein N0F65_011548 [Lagenidium giganteum]